MRKQLKLALPAAALFLTALLLAGCSANPAPETAPGETPPETTAAVETEPTAEIPTETTQPPTEPEEERALGRDVQIDGQKYHYNSRLRTVLFMGIDTKEGVESHEVVGNGGRADVILLFILNPDTETTQMVEISRDTITKVDVYNDSREKLYSGKMQINMQYAFGDSPERSCMLMKNRVSELLYELPISSYCSVTMDGIAAAVDYLGGITLTLKDDWTDINEAYTAGATITLDAKSAERFIRYRDVENVDGNDVRMSRHSWFIREVFRQVKRNPDFDIRELFMKLIPYMETDLDVNTLSNLSQFAMSPDICKLPGEVAAGKHHAEYHLNEEALKQLLLELYYEKVD